MRHSICDHPLVSDALAEPLAVDLMMTIDDALALPVLTEGVPEVLAGHTQLGRPIRWAHSGEFPDMPSVLKGGELLLTHGMRIGGREDRQRRYVADLARVGLAGLVIELGSGMKRVPEALIDEARCQDLPLIVLHRPIPWVEVTEAIHRTIVNRQGRLLERGQELHDRFAGLLAAGAGIPEVLQALAESVRNPVALSRNGELLYSAAAGYEHATVSAALDGALRHLPHAPESIEVPIVVGGDAQWGVAIALALGRQLNAFDRIALERAVPLLALAFQRSHEVEVLAARDRGDFLTLLLDPRTRPGERQAHRRAAEIGFAERASWLLPLAVEVAAGLGRLDERRWALVTRELRQELTSRRTSAVVGTLAEERHLGIIVALGAPEERAQAAGAIAAAVRRALLTTRSDAEIIVCAGAASPSWREAGDSLRETVDAVEVMRHAPAQAWHDVSRPDLRRLLWGLRGKPPLTDFVDRSLAPLEAHDARGGGALLHTLEVLCAHGGRKAETARALHLERQSLYKRLAKIETILQADLADEDTLLGLHIAIRGRRLVREFSN
jgi:PucR family transcriptional regulator, purine catabolism regulatory protein